MTVRTRFAPSPTGILHLGNSRTALYAWLYARRHGGDFVLRIEDTDRVRSTQAAVDAVLEALDWLGLDADEGPIFQTQRFDRYAEVTRALLDAGKAYHCYCSAEEIERMRNEAMEKGLKPRYDGRCRDRKDVPAGVNPVVRFRNPEHGEVVVDDLVKGRAVFDNAELDDLIIARGDGTPTYNFTVVVDDSDMRITHVIRGDDHLNNTPRQINLFHALGIEPPAFAHLPMIHGADGGKLSKRHGAVNVLDYRDAGYLPEAMLNYLLRLGWSHGDQEIFSRDEMTARFDLPNVSRSAARFDPDKLLWVNQQHIQSAPAERLAELLGPRLAAAGVPVEEGPALTEAADAFRERSSTIAEMAEWAEPYYADYDDFEPKAAKAHLRPVAREPLLAVRAALAAVDDWSEAATQQAVEDVAERTGTKLGKVAQPLRVALTGRAASPGIGVTLALVGRDRSLVRIDRALAFIDEREAAAG